MRNSGQGFHTDAAGNHLVQIGRHEQQGNLQGIGNPGREVLPGI